MDLIYKVLTYFTGKILYGLNKSIQYVEKNAGNLIFKLIYLKLSTTIICYIKIT